MNSKVNLASAFAKFNSHWDPHLAGSINDMHVKIAKFEGSFDWHHHDVEDEFFMVIKGQFIMHFRDRSETIHEGEFIIVPHGTEHKPEAIEECEVLMLEPKSTLNTGTERTERTVSDLKTI